ncbi:glycosyltransferase [Marinobacteraceae bacterium S3BR75-40.1]
MALLKGKESLPHFYELTPACPEHERDIKKSWPEKNGRPLVSVLCHTYNQVDYIRQTLESILMQRTRFPFEIIVHDDASTDGTSDIVKAYAAKYPSLIVPVIQTENQKSRGGRPILLSTPHAQAHYLALCEGDDFWCDPLKLQKQLDWMLQHPENYLIGTRCYRVFEEQVMDGDHYGADHPVIYDPVALARDGGGILASPSLFFRRELIDALGDWFPLTPYGDYYFQILAAVLGKVTCLPDHTCAYRVKAKGSWSARKVNAAGLVDRVSQVEKLAKDDQFLSLYGKKLSRIMLSYTCYVASINLLKQKRYALAIQMAAKSREYHRWIKLKQALLGFTAKILSGFSPSYRP